MKLRILINLKKLRYLLPIAYLLMIFASYVLVFSGIGRIVPSSFDDILIKLVVYVNMSGIAVMSLIPVIGKLAVANPLYMSGYFMVGMLVFSYLFFTSILFAIGYLLEMVLRHFKK